MVQLLYEKYKILIRQWGWLYITKKKDLKIVNSKELIIMKRKYFILIVLICCLSLSACADSTKQSENNGKKVSEATSEPTMDPVFAEENVINSFYDTMYEVRNDLKKYTYSTVA